MSYERACRNAIYCLDAQGVPLSPRELRMTKGAYEALFLEMTGRPVGPEESRAIDAGISPGTIYGATIRVVTL